MRTSIVASILVASGAVHAAASAEVRDPSETIADRLHTTAVQVVATADGEHVNVASGVMAGGGMVFTDLRAVFARGPDGAVATPTAIVVLTATGAFPARIAEVARDVDVAVLELPQAARGLEGPPLAEGSLAAGDRLLAIRASKQGAAQPPWLPRALAAWGDPRVPGDGLYDERYITW
jgi:hypothetical protein